jgi:hypothetical protein
MVTSSSSAIRLHEQLSSNCFLKSGWTQGAGKIGQEIQRWMMQQTLKGTKDGTGYAMARDAGRITDWKSQLILLLYRGIRISPCFRIE